MYEHQDVLAELNTALPVGDKLAHIHRILRSRLPGIERVAVALYEPGRDLLKTYVYSGDQSPLVHYEARLGAVPSLQEVRARRRPRLVNDSDTLYQGGSQHSRKLRAAGFGSSYTLPIFLDGSFLGFVFFNARAKGVFQDEVLWQLDVFGHLISLTVAQELEKVQTLVAAVQTARDLTHHRDVETGAHTERTAHYARLIALALADDYGLDDEFIERLFQFSPLHDIGKIGVPDAILHKPGRLDDEEFAQMQQHVRKGREIIDALVSDFGFEQERITLLRNIAQYHHEAVDGSGYLFGLAGEQIPIEARITAVADVFDALTSARPYKEAWDNPRAFDMLRVLAGSKLDARCVEAFLARPQAIVEIQERFRDPVD
jgi:HD-GYP domain-containing protein (c-di-GMP phosphodiesterase class II)